MEWGHKTACQCTKTVMRWGYYYFVQNYISNYYKRLNYERLVQTRSSHISTHNPTYLTSTHRISHSFIISVKHMCTPFVKAHKGQPANHSHITPRPRPLQTAGILHPHPGPQGLAPTQHKESRPPGSRLPGASPPSPATGRDPPPRCHPRRTTRGTATRHG